MKKAIVYTISIFTATILLYSYNLPKGWFKAGSQPDKYDMGTDIGSGRNGKNAAMIKSNSVEINGFGTLMQQSLPDEYLVTNISNLSQKWQDLSGYCIV